MNGLTHGFWDLADHSLQWIGRGAARILFRRGCARDDGALCAATGGALVCAVLGGAFGFTLFDPSQQVSEIGGTLLGALLGLCVGILFGSIVEAVDSTIKDLLGTLNSK